MCFRVAKGQERQVRGLSVETCIEEEEGEEEEAERKKEMRH